MRYLFVTTAAASALAVAALAAGPGEVAYPEGFRAWTHVGSAVMGPEAQGSPAFEGLHHIYANPAAMQGYRTGSFPAGSVLVFDLHTVKVAAGVTAPVARKQLDVMVKDASGWRFAEFTGESRVARAETPDWSVKTCAACHAKAPTDFVFSRWRE